MGSIGVAFKDHVVAKRSTLTATPDVQSICYCILPQVNNVYTTTRFGHSSVRDKTPSHPSQHPNFDLLLACAFVPAVDGRHAPPVDSAVLQGDGPGCGFQSLSYVANGIDVCDPEGRKQCTKTQDNANVQYECSWPQACPQGRVHTRVVQQLALPVHSVQDSKRLIRAIREVLQGLRSSGTRDLLHLGVNTGSNMLIAKFEGPVDDCDSAITIPLNTYIMGIWQFFPIKTLREWPSTKAHGIIDDVESCFWVLYYTAIHYYRRSSGYPNLLLFDEHEEQITDGVIVRVGGVFKFSALTFDRKSMAIFESQPMTRVIRTFSNVISDYNPFDEATEQPKDVTGILEIFDKALASVDWPEDDGAVERQYPQGELRSIPVVQPWMGERFTRYARLLPPKVRGYAVRDGFS
ncbi:hypothetical protein BDW22DRAFT_1148355 [Trametopsis cervina]|nr:hypothetical protein BDW22DRAFT_1148355 [Trametopsis cervina]